MHDHGDPCVPTSLRHLDGDLDLDAGAAHFLDSK
jgi:hypothetical protein